jgi:hypothetical protein
LFNLPPTIWSKTRRSTGLSGFIASRAFGGITLERPFHRFEQGVPLDGLGQEVHGAGLHRAHARRDVRVAGEEDDRQRHVHAPKGVLQIEA